MSLIVDNNLEHLPLILAGPILRRTEADAVTVWLALKHHCQVTLKVYATQAGTGELISDLVLKGDRSTVQLGKYLHIVAVTATPINQRQLQPGQIYAYDLDFQEGVSGGTLLQALNSEKFLTGVIISYFDHRLPTFAMPPDDLNHLKIVHGSCRKIHGGGSDALSILDQLIEKNASIPNSRPQQLFLTGDQIYGDDVADPLLSVLTEVGNTLLGWEEDLPIDADQYQKPSKFKPGTRSDIAKDYGGFTAMLHNQPEKAKSHLFSLGEYYAMYLFAWSQVFWQDNFPKGNTVKTNPKAAKKWDEEVKTIKNFARDLPKVRRALANVPTYMICDDHDISDDWYLNLEWCMQVLSKPLGRRVLQNGLLAYAIFQAWGNTPEQFQNGKVGHQLLEATKQWSVSAGTDKLVLEKIAKYLGLPPIDMKTNLPSIKEDRDVLILDRADSNSHQILDWHYTVNSFKHEVIVLDTRTWRGYPKDIEIGSKLPTLISPTAFIKQLRQPLQRKNNLNNEITLLVLPTNLVSLGIIHFVQQQNLKQGKVFENDIGDDWTLNKLAFNQLLSEVFKERDRVVILSGDIHYSAAVLINYWFYQHLGNFEANQKVAEQSRVLVQLTASSFKNAEWKTYLINTKIKSFLPELPQNWAGWNKYPQLFEIQSVRDRLRIIKLNISERSPLIRQIYGSSGNQEISWEIAVKNTQFLPDWRYSIKWIKRQTAKNFT
ncbi:MAG: PhoD-like phosphatase, partial [Crinalium sp.]